MAPGFLVTGASGYVGAALAAALAKHGQVIGLSRNPNRQHRILSFEHDLTQALPVCPGLKCATVVHCAGVIRSSDSIQYWTANVVGTQNLLDWSSEHGVRRFVHFSTGGVYGYNKAKRMREADGPRPADAYSESKHLSELVARQHCEFAGIELVIFRLYFPFSLNQPNGIFRLVEDSVRTGAELKIKCDGAPRMTPVHIEDVVDAVLRSVSPDFPPGFYNLCGDEDISFLELVRSMEFRVGMRAKLVYTQETAGDVMGDNSLLRQTGWRPARRLQSVLADHAAFVETR